MRIGCIGTGGTGKTTTLRLLEPYTEFPYQPGVMRGVFKEQNVPAEANQHKMSAIDRWRLQKAGFDKKIAQDDANPVGLFDRTLLDHMIYCMIWAWERITDNTCKSMLLLTRENLEAYDLLFYFPLYDWDVPDDGMRENRYASRLAWDLMARSFLADVKIGPIIMPNDTPQARAEFMLGEIQKRIRVGGAPVAQAAR